MVEERVSKGVALFNSLDFSPVIYNELKKEFPQEYCDMYRNIVLDTCILHSDWKENEILDEVVSLLEIRGHCPLGASPLPTLNK